MKIKSSTDICLQTQKNNNCIKNEFINEHLYSSTKSDIVSFRAKTVEKSCSKSYIFLNRLLNKNLCDCNFEKIEGLQEGLKSFEGLSMKQIAMALTNLHAINMVSGCNRHCLHCYANAQPFLKRGSFEDLKQICDDIKELEKRTGAKPCYHHGEPYIDISFDSDALDCHLFDKKGQKHDYVEIAKMIYESTGYKPVFDTNGWDTEEKQKIADDYVKKLVENDNYQYFHQINVSINPFNPKYVKALKFGYPVEKLYSPIQKVLCETDMPQDDVPSDFIKARELYTNYVKNTVNTLLTFKPLVEKGKLGIITRTLDNQVPNMAGFRMNDFGKTLDDISSELYLRHIFGKLTAKEYEQYIKLLEKVSVRIFGAGRMEKFYKLKNGGSLDGIDRIDNERDTVKKNLEKIKEKKKLSAGNMRYLKMIAPDGRVFLYNNYSVIPTDIQLKTSVEKVEKPFQIDVEDFILTEDMMDVF